MADFLACEEVLQPMLTEHDGFLEKENPITNPIPPAHNTSSTTS